MIKSESPDLRVAFLGASGAVGDAALKQLMSQTDVAVITLLNRRSLPLEEKSNLAQHVVDVFDSATYATFLARHSVAICTFGVGEPSKVSKEEFTRVDKQAVLDFAVACKVAGVKHFSLLSSVGADAASRSYYLRSKGELRDAIAALGFERFSVFQPSVILTPTNRYGFSQGVLLTAWPVVSALLVGGLRKYRGVPVSVLGTAIAANVLRPGSGVEIFHWDDIHRLGGHA